MEASVKKSLKLRISATVVVVSLFWGIAVMFPQPGLIIAVLLSIAAIIYTIKNIETGMNDALEKIKTAEEQTALMLDMNPLCSQLWDENFKLIDCSEASVNMFGFNSKQEFIGRFSECSPEYQPDGQHSEEKMLMLLKKAFEEGRIDTEWMHQTPDGKPLPAEVSLCRVSYKDGHVVAGFMIDLSDVVGMENTITGLKKEAEKVYYGIFNRRYFDENLNRLLKSLTRSKSTLSLMMIEIDFFEKYDEIYGRTKSNNCIKTVAEKLTKCLMRDDDFVARYGDGKFAAVLPYTDEAGARIVAKKMLKSVQDSKIVFENGGSTGFATISIGSTTGKPRHPLSGNDYIARADEMLSISKENKGNKCTFEDI